MLHAPTYTCVYLYDFQLSRWPEKILKNLSYHIQNISFPDNDESGDGRDWKTIYRPCATQRLFFAVSIDYMGARAPGKSQRHSVPYYTDPDILKTHKATKPAFNVGPPSARQRNAIKWRFAGGPTMAHF